MNDDEKDKRIRYLEAIIHDFMSNNNVDDIEKYTNKAYCQRCMGSFNRLGDRPMWKNLLDGFCYMATLLFIIFLMAIIFFVWRG